MESGTGYSHSVGYEYDEKNMLTSMVETINGKEKTTSYTYDDDDRITSVTDGTATKNYTYDAFGRLTSQTTKHGSSTVKTDTFGFMPRSTTSQTSSQIQTHTVNIGGTDTVYTYTYDANGNITSITGGGNTVTYAYDSANQLIREDNLAGDYTHTWTYDNAGNILTRTEYDYASAETEPSGTGETVTYTYGDNNWGDLLTGYDGKTISYDKVGNPESDGTWEYDWQHGRQLARMESQSNSGTYWNFTYNADGLRTKRTNGTKTYEYIYNGSQLTQMTVDGKTLTFSYDASGTPLSVNYNGTTYYYVTNIQGDVTAILTSSGTKVVSYTYDAWGNPLATTGSLASTLGAHNPLRYRGYVWDSETELYYLQSRYYNPEVSRFINADVLISNIGGQMLGNNTFGYCLNNPVNLVDSLGLYPQPYFDNPAGELGYKIGQWIGGVIKDFPTKEEHYNRNDYQKEVFETDPRDIINSDDWERQPDAVNKFHKNTIGEQGLDAKDNVKYMTTDRKKEVIINFTNPTEPKIVTDPFNIGTYNFGTGISHVILDVLPYWLWGNSETDSGWEYAYIRLFGA